VASRRQIFVGGVPIGGGTPVAVQSMTKTETADYDATLRQIKAIADAGGDIVRVAVPQLVGVEGAPPDGGARFHRLAVPQFLTLWEEWEKANLLDRVLTWAGAYVPRFARRTTVT